MKKLTLCFITSCLLLALHPFQLSASTAASSTNVLNASQAENLLLRLDEIKLMDKSNLKALDKKNLRAEVISIKKQLSDPLGGGIYLSVGALIIIVILLIILL